MTEKREADPMPKARKISTLTPDPRNANKGTPKGRKALAESLRDYGAGRSILLDRHGTIIAGNKTAEAAPGAGILNVRVIQTDGKELIAVQRMDLDLSTDAAAKKLAIADNRVSELDLSWDQDVLAELGGEIDLSTFFPDTAAAAAGEPAIPDSSYKEQYGVIVMCGDAKEQQAVFERFQKEGLTVRVVTT